MSHSKEADTPGNEEFVAKYQEMFGGDEVPEDAADAYAAAQVLQAAVKGVGTVDRDDQLELADWLRENEVDTILGPLGWDETGARRASSSSASGRAACRRSCCPRTRRRLTRSSRSGGRTAAGSKGSLPAGYARRSQ